MKNLMLRSLVLLLAACPLIVRAAVPPVNDKFVNATVLTQRSVTLHNQNGSAATSEALDPYIGGFKINNTVWYRFDALYTVNTAHVTISHLTAGVRVGVFVQLDPDGGQGTLNEVAEKVVLAAGTDTVTFATAAGRRYYICVVVPGPFDLTLQQPGQDNDYFADATVLPGNQGAVIGSTINCSNDNNTDRPAAAFSNMSNGVWYKWTPSISGPVAIDTNFSYVTTNTSATAPGAGDSYDTNLYVYTGTTLANLVQVATDDDGGTGHNSRASFTATAGTTYTIWVGSYDSTVTSVFHLEYFPETSPGNFEVVAPFTTLSESQGPVNVEIRRHFAGASVTPTVTVATANGSAIGGSDFTAIAPTVLTFTPGGSNALVRTVTLNPLPDTVQESDEYFSLALSSPTAGSGIDGGSTSTLFYIRNDPSPVAPGFTTTTLRVKETDGTVYIPVQRLSTVGSTAFNVVPVNLGSSTAQPNVDYTLSTGPYTIAPGVGLTFVGVHINDDARATGDKTFMLGIQSASGALAFDGSSNLTITITDTDAASAPAPVRLTALLEPGYGIGASVDAQITAGGSLTGKLITSRGTLAFTGKFDATGTYSFTFGAPGATRKLTIQSVNGTRNTYAITLRDNDMGTYSSTLATGGSYTATSPCAQAGLYTLYGAAIGGSTATSSGSLKVDALGNATLTGTICDGTPFVATGAVDGGGSVSVALSLFSNQGRIAISGTLPATSGVSGNISMRLVRPSMANQTVALPPFDNLVPSYTYLYTPPQPGHRVFSEFDPAGAGKVTVSGGGYAVPTTQLVSVSTANVVTLAAPATNIPSLKLTLNTATGLFTGTLSPPAPGFPARPISGALFTVPSGDTGIGTFYNPAAPTGAGLLQLLGP